MATAVQTTYSDTAGVAYPGMLGDATDFNRVAAYQNSDVAVITSGLAVAKDGAAPDLKAKNLAAASDTIAGFTVHSHARNNITAQGYEVGSEMNVLQEGPLYVACEQTVAVTDPVYVRFAAGGGGSVIGSVRKDSDSGTAVLCKGARFIVGGSATTPPMIWYSQARQEGQSELVEIPFSNASQAATTTVKQFKTRADRTLLIESVDYDNPTGLATSDTNYFVMTLQQGATVIATFSTKTTGGQGSLPADSYVSFVLSALANRVVPPGTVITLVDTLTGTLTLPAGSGVIHGRYI